MATVARLQDLIASTSRDRVVIVLGDRIPQETVTADRAWMWCDTARAMVEHLAVGVHVQTWRIFTAHPPVPPWADLRNIKTMPSYRSP